jgi:putative Holliday junction resolvase
MAIDYGRKRTGLAVTDAGRMIAVALDVVPTHQLWDYLENYFGAGEVGLVVVGYPVQANNQPSEALRYINPFIKKLKKIYPSMAVDTCDERFTSRMARQAMIDAGARKKDRQNKGLVDKVSATIILQSYMEQKNI